MKAKVISLDDFKKKRNTNILTKNDSNNGYVNKYKEALKKMTKEELLKFEELLEN